MPRGGREDVRILLFEKAESLESVESVMMFLSFLCFRVVCAWARPVWFDGRPSESGTDVAPPGPWL